jgi:hypothetical protein
MIASNVNLSPVNLLDCDICPPNITIRKKREVTAIGRAIIRILYEEDPKKVYHYIRTCRVFERYRDWSSARRRHFYVIPLNEWYELTGLSRDAIIKVLTDVQHKVMNMYVFGKEDDTQVVVL